MKPGLDIRKLIGIALAFNLSLAAWLAMRVWRMTRRYPVPEREIAWLQGARSQQMLNGRKRVCVRQWGNGAGPCVLLVHGWGARGSQLGAFALPLQNLGYRVVALDLPGHGASDGRATDLPECHAALRLLQQQFGEFHCIVAHSYGAVVASYAMRNGFAVQRAVLISAPALGRKIFQGYLDWLAAPARLSERLIEIVRRRYGADAFEQMSPLEHAPELRQPCLLVHDRNDREVPLASAERLAQRWRDATLLVTDNLGHRRILRDPACVAQVVQFIDSGALSRSQDRQA